MANKPETAAVQAAKLEILEAEDELVAAKAKLLRAKIRLIDEIRNSRRRG